MKKILHNNIASKDFENILPFSRPKTIGQQIALAGFINTTEVNLKIVEYLGTILNVLQSRIESDLTAKFPQINPALLNLAPYFQSLYQVFFLFARNNGMALQYIEMLSNMFKTHITDTQLLKQIFELKRWIYLDSKKDVHYKKLNKVTRPVMLGSSKSDSEKEKFKRQTRAWTDSELHRSKLKSETLQGYNQKLSKSDLKAANFNPSQYIHASKIHSENKQPFNNKDLKKLQTQTEKAQALKNKEKQTIAGGQTSNTLPSFLAPNHSG